jgi:hypothetical protein
MWRSPRTLKLISDLVRCEKVGEVIVIDNNPENSITHDNSKVKIISNGQNNYVNPSWNMGVHAAAYPLIALCNDDINFNANKMFELEPESGDIFGIGENCYEIEREFDYPVVTPTAARRNGWGCLMMFRKEDYKPIDEQLKVSYGDDWLFLNFANRFNINGIRVETEMSTTSREAEFIAVAEDDGKVWNSLK